MAEEFDFDSLESLEEIAIPFKYKGKEYCLREATENQAGQFISASARTARMADGKVTGIDGAGELRRLLVSLCVVEISEKGEKPVAKQVIAGWPSRVVKPIYERARKISGLGDEETEEALTKQIKELQEKLDALRAGKDTSAKNLPGDTDDTSA